jgi:hypothetical protein
MKFKEFIKKHKTAIIVILCIGGTAAVIAFLRRYAIVNVGSYQKALLTESKALAEEGRAIAIALEEAAKDTEGIIHSLTLDEVIDFLADIADSDKFAIFKEREYFDIVRL